MGGVAALVYEHIVWKCVCVCVYARNSVVVVVLVGASTRAVLIIHFINLLELGRRQKVFLVGAENGPGTRWGRLLTARFGDAGRGASCAVECVYVRAFVCVRQI